MPPTDEVKFSIPNPPIHEHALDLVPSEVQANWKASYAKHYKRAAGNGRDGMSAHAEALREANRLVAVETPTDHEDAYAIPDWQIMKREEVEFVNLPLHARRDLREAGHAGHAGCKYVRVYTSDGKEHFFPIPEKVA